jgi:hypothetical protein
LEQAMMPVEKDEIDSTAATAPALRQCRCHGSMCSECVSRRYLYQRSTYDALNVAKCRERKSCDTVGRCRFVFFFADKSQRRGRHQKPGLEHFVKRGVGYGVLLAGSYSSRAPSAGRKQYKPSPSEMIPNQNPVRLIKSLDLY